MIMLSLLVLDSNGNSGADIRICMTQNCKSEIPRNDCVCAEIISVSCCPIKLD